MSKKTSKKTAAQPRRWSLGVFTSKESGKPLVTYCRVDGTVTDYMAKKVTTKKASVHGVFKNMTYAEASAKLLKQAGPKLVKAAKKTPSREEPQRKAA